MALGTVVCVAALTAVVAVRSDWGREKVRSQFVERLNRLAHGTVRIGSVSGNILQHVTLHDVSITDSLGAPFVTVAEVSGRYAWRALLARKIDLWDVQLVRPVIVLDRRPGGQWNYLRIFPDDSTSRGADTAAMQFGEWVVLHNAQVVDGRVTIRVPWQPAAKLAGSNRQRAIRQALDSTSRIVVKPAEGGYQRVQEYRSVNARVALARITQPGYRTRLVNVDSLRMTALAFAAPAADVRQLAGHVEVNGDSAWFDVTEFILPSSKATLSGRYSLASGDLALRTIASPLAFADAHFLYPDLPDSGQATFDMALSMTADGQRYVVRQLKMNTGSATASGDVDISVGETVELHHTNIVFAGVDTRLIEEVVPTLQLRRQGVLSGRARLNGGRSAMQVDGDVSFRDRQTGVSRVIAAGEIGAMGNGVQAHGLHVSLSPLQVDLAFASLAPLPVHGTLTGTAVLDGSTDSQLAARQLDLTHVDRGARTHVAGSGAVRAGKPPWLALDVMADSLSLVTANRFAPALGLRGNVSGPIHVAGTTRALAINAALTAADGGAVTFAGDIDVAAKDIGYRLDVMTTQLDARLLSEKSPRTRLNALVTARGRGFDLATMQSEFVVAASNSTIDTVAVDSSRLRVRVASGLATVDSFALRSSGVSFTSAGTFGIIPSMSGTLAYSVRIDSLGTLARYLPLDTATVLPRPGILAERLRLARRDSAQLAEKLAVARAAGVSPQAVPVNVALPRSIRRDTVAGSVFASGTVTGGFDEFDMRGTARATEVLALGSTVQRASATYRVRGARTAAPRVEVTASGDSVSTAGFAFDSIRAQASYLSPGGTASVHVFQNAQRDFAAKVTYAVLPDQHEVRVDTMSFRFDTTRWSATRSATVRWGQPGFQVDSIDLQNGHGGRLFLDGWLPTEGVADLHVKVVDFDLGDLTELLQSDVPVRGLLSAEARVRGGTLSPIVDGTTSLMHATYAGAAVPDVRATFGYADQRLQASAIASGAGRSVAVGSASLPLDLTMTTVAGSRLLDGPASIDITTDSLPLDVASRFTEAISEVRGFVVGSATLRGSIRKPVIKGDLRLAQGEMRVAALGVKLLAVNGALHVRGDSLVIDSLTAISAGHLRVSGSLGIAEPRSPSFDLRLNADNARFLDNDKGRARADADITVQGPFDAVAVTGTARIRQGVLYIPRPDSREMISAGDAVIFAVVDSSDRKLKEVLPTSSPLFSNVTMNLQLSVERDTWVRSSEANVEIFSDGELQITVNKKRGTLTLVGVVNTDRGEYEFLSKRFQIKRGSATFTGGADINPLLQLTGEYELKQPSQQALNIRVLIGGTLRAPSLTLESDAQPTISQSDLLSYLAFGSESGSLLQVGGSSVSGRTAGGGLVGTTAALATQQLAGVALGVTVNELEGRAARSLGADVFNIAPANVPPELAGGNFSGLSTFLRSTQLEYGKYLTSQTFVGLNVQATAALGFRVEHRFTRQQGLSLESTLQPRYFLLEPSLAPQGLKTANAFGFFLVRRWRF